MKSRTAGILFLLSSLFSSPSSAQGAIEIFADVQGNDTLRQLVTICTTQLKKSNSVDFTIKPSALYQGKGMYLNNTAVSGQRVKPSIKLLQSGVEAFSIDAGSGTVRILGNSNMAIGHGIFSYLELLGFRFYFASPDWHITPSNPALFPKWNVVSKPSFLHRRIWYGYGTGSKIADEDYNFWVMANRLGGSMNASFGHAYEDIAFRNLDTFAKHPEWCFPPLPKGTLPYDIKFDVTKEDLIQFIIQDVEKRIQKSLKEGTDVYKMISMAPSDGLGTCNTPACHQLGSITDRVYYLTNRVAKAIQKKYPATMIGCMAYGEYMPPPTKKIEPNVFVAITTAFNTTKYSIEQLTDEWRKKGANVGIYDYFSWYAWDFDLPGQSLASKTSDIEKSIKKYYNKGVKAYDAESSIGWISKGLGYYLAAKYMWDINTDGESIKKGFFGLCFNKAAGTMKKLWQEWENYSYTAVRESDLARWIDYTWDAEKQEQDPLVKKRLFQVKSYLHYLVLYRNYQMSKSESTLLSLLNYGYRKLDDGSVAGFPAFFELGNRSGFDRMGYVDNAKWKTNSAPVAADEISLLLQDDRRKLKIAEPVKEYTSAKKFTTVPALSRYDKLITDSSNTDNAYWYTNEWVIQIKNKGVNNYIDFTGDFIADSTNRKPIKISIYPYTADGIVSTKPTLLYYEYKAVKDKEKISLSRLNPGYYTVIIDDPVKIFRLKFSPSVNFSMVMRPGRQINSTALFYSFIYVPEGTKKFNIIKSSLLGLITPTGRQLDFMTDKPDDIQVEVQKGEAGLWRLKPMYGKFFVEGIPPYLGTSARQMLIPAFIK
ncbi:MAG: DUF4838 domain-containing protein [Bacteroidota bacterium]